ncbi:MAG: endonuclease III domain-containing protein [Streptosporangiaceae bacterium]
MEGVEADDYPASQALISRLRRPGRATARTWADVPPGYEGFEIVEHRREIDAPYSPQCLAVKIREDDLASWALHGWLRSQLPRKSQAMPGAAKIVPVPPALPPAPSPNAQAVGRALLAHADALADQLKNGTLSFTPDAAADALIREDPFAFLLAVISDMGIRAERAWALPYLLRTRLGYLTPGGLAANPEAVRAAVQQAPKLHRFVNVVPDWLVQAAHIVLDRYGGDAGRLWSDAPTAVELRRRLEAFPGVGQKKAAMAVEILARDLGQPLRELAGSDVAYDVHLRRVFLRTGLAEHDSVDQMVAVARALYPGRPGALDLPAWDVGRRWCRPTNPDCPVCPLITACPRLIERGSQVRGA